MTTLTRNAGFAKAVREVACRTTPGEDIDVVVTECGVAVNPERRGLIARLEAAGVPLVDLASLATPPSAPTPRPTSVAPVLLVEHRDGSIIEAR